MQIVKDGYYVGDDGNQVVLKIADISDNGMVKVYQYDSQGEFVTQRLVTQVYFRTWAKQRVQPRDNPLAFW